MACYYPLLAYQPRVGVRPKILSKHVYNRHLQKNLQLPQGYIRLACGQCIGCRLDKSRDWALRAIHEASFHEENAFITLTYDNDHVPELVDRETGHVIEDLRKEDFSVFMKALRNYLNPKGAKNLKKVRFLHCGEYGEACKNCRLSRKFCECAEYVPDLGRPHHHAALFGYQFPDLQLWKVKNGNRLYTSEILKSIWGKGAVIVGEVTFESAAYIARYVVKKITGKDAEDHYLGRQPESVNMSRRPGIGKDFFLKYQSDFFPKDFITRNGNRLKVPRYYSKLFDELDSDAMALVKQKRRANHPAEHQTPLRLLQRDSLQQLRHTRLPRKFIEEE